MIAGLLLAAGRSTRMGRNKLLTVYRGRPLVAHAAEALLGSSVDRVFAVTGHDAARVAAALPAGVTIVHNAAYAAGLSTSLRAGLDALPAATVGALIMLSDMPHVSARHIDALIAEPAMIGVPYVAGVRGNPVFWPRRHFATMRALTGDRGARAMLDRHAAEVRAVALDDDAVLIDIDTPADFARLGQGDDS